MRRLALSATLLCAAPLTAQDPHAGHPAPTASAPSAAARDASAPRLGEIHFPSSAPPAAHAEFERGVLYLHNFHYPQAIDAFRRARTLDPRDVMSAAFEAFAYTHPVWNQQDTASARAALRSLAPTRAARAAMARSPRERAWLDAIEVLYAGDAPKAARDTAFSRAMARLHADDPRDAEAATFYALSLLGLNQGVREPTAYAMAEAISDSVRRAHPRHPGALHYLIHAVDDPASATRGLDAAAAYGALAPDAGHAQHMTSHIFIALGMWDDVVRANQRPQKGPTENPLYAFGHGTHWLSYALLQQGKLHEARQWVDSMLIYHKRVHAGELPPVRGWDDVDGHAITMAATYVLGAEAWDIPLAHARFDTTHVGLVARTRGDFFVGVAAARRAARSVDVTEGSRDADRRLADSMLARIESRIAAARSSARPPGLADAEVMATILRAELSAARNHPDSAVALLREAAARADTLPFEFGPPGMMKPPNERAAEILYFRGDYAGALNELAKSERQAPSRSRARFVRARSLLALGRRDEAVAEYKVLAQLWRDADPTFPQREEARWGSTVLAAGLRDPAIAADTIEYSSGELVLRGALYRPIGAGRHPAIVALHGSNACWSLLQADQLGRLFAARGYVAFFPCRRGLGLSKGRGVAILDQLEQEGIGARDTTFARRSTELLLSTQLPDVRAAIAAVRSRHDVDATRVAVTGISYGGLLTMLAAEADPTLRAAVAFAPAAMNWGWNAPLRTRLLEGARRTRVPVLVLQAANDWNVGPTTELPVAVRAGGGEAKGSLYPAIGLNANDGHGLMTTAPSLWKDEVLTFLATKMR